MSPRDRERLRIERLKKQRKACDLRASLVMQRLEKPEWTELPKILLLYWPAKYGKLWECPPDDVDGEGHENEHMADCRAYYLTSHCFEIYFLRRHDGGKSEGVKGD
jgi:hypothetical protein